MYGCAFTCNRASHHFLWEAVKICLLVTCAKLWKGEISLTAELLGAGSGPLWELMIVPLCHSSSGLGEDVSPDMIEVILQKI